MNAHRVGLLAGLLAGVALLLPSPVQAAAQPDVVVLMVDDLGDVGPRVLERLPNLGPLFLGGRVFEQAFGEQPLCCPGRATFLTGQHVRHHGVTHNDARLLDPSRTIATALQAVGYRTGLVGKYLNGAELMVDKSPPGWDRVAMLMGDEKSWAAAPDSSSWVIDDAPASLGYRDRAVADLSVRFVAEAPVDRPLFLWTSPRAPHWGPSRLTPWRPAIEPRYVGDPRCSGIAPWRPPSYSFAKQPGGWPLDDICRSLLTVDDEVAGLEAAFAARGSEPVWMLTSDNGMAWGAHGFPVKNVPWATPLPLYFAGRGVISGVDSALISAIDFAPTLAELAGASVPWADGVSFAALLAGDGSIRESMIEDEPVAGYTAGPWRAKWHAVRTLRWHLIRIGSQAALLFDLAADPWELQPVTNRAVARQLRLLWPYGSF